MSIFRNNVVEYTVNKVVDNGISISVQNGEVSVNAPWYITRARIQEIVEEKKKWIIKKIAEREIESAMEKARILLGFAPEDYRIQAIDGVLAKCENDIITINPEIINLDRKSIEYIIIHEYCHLKYKTHSKKFINLLEKNVKNYKKYEKKLKKYKY